ncbi:MAG: cytochrome c1 [Alphaproteobacteria bacterium CG11_big_fil_rev_8_21_14_0_20_44_7]|nr:MAG: cytochrome c1 [Alphaproteobacteria bacterium CG11_big_fil_rev_8_21_14_0_20_44_7]
MDWSFDGIFGKYDRQSAQRGYQVYKEVCASCHGLRLISFRQLQDLGFSEAETKALAAEYNYDSINDDGDIEDRPGNPSDRFKSPFANAKAAAAMNNGKAPPDLSLMVKARPNGANYIYSLLTGYESAPAHAELQPGLNFNPYFPGEQIAMAAPLQAGQVEYMDGTEATVGQMSQDVVNFLQWTAEPDMEKRKRMGIKIMILLSVMTIFFYAAKVRIWARVK